jgi:transaldolase
VVGELVPSDGGDADELLAQFEAAGIGVDALAQRLQEEGKESFAKSWADLLATIESKTGAPSP